MKIEGREVVLVSIENPYYNFLKKNFTDKRIVVDDCSVHVLTLPGMHYMLRLVANMCMANPFNIVLVLGTGPTGGLPYVPIDRRPILKDLIRQVYNMNFYNFYVTEKALGLGNTEIINKWFADYDLSDENINKYVKIISRYRKKPMI